MLCLQLSVICLGNTTRLTFMKCTIEVVGKTVLTNSVSWKPIPWRHSDWRLLEFVYGLLLGNCGYQEDIFILNSWFFLVERSRVFHAWCQFRQNFNSLSGGIKWLFLGWTHLQHMPIASHCMAVIERGRGWWGEEKTERRLQREGKEPPSLFPWRFSPH